MKKLVRINLKKFQLIFAIAFSLNIYGQRHSISYSLGVDQMSFHSDESVFKNQTTKGAYLAMDWLPSKVWGIGLEYHSNILREHISFWDLRLKLGFILFNGYRVQIPIYPNFNICQIKNKSEDWYSAIGIGGKAGLKIYLTNSIALEGFYHSNMYFISATDEKRLESDVTFTTNFISLGILYKL